MKIPIFVFLLFIINLSDLKSQSVTVTFELKMLDPCDSSINTISFYRLKNDNSEYLPDYNTGICTLEEGNYHLSYVMENVFFDEEKIYTFKESGNYTDTLLKKTISKCIEPTTRPNFVGYCCCGSLCNGLIKEYYKNGEIRFKGKFKKGLPVGKLYYFDKKGSLIKIEKYNRKGKLKKTIKNE